MRRTHNIKRRHGSGYLPVHVQQRTDVVTTLVGLNRTLLGFAHQSETVRCGAYSLWKYRNNAKRPYAPSHQGGLRADSLQLGGYFNALQKRIESLHFKGFRKLDMNRDGSNT